MKVTGNLVWLILLLIFPEVSIGQFLMDRPDTAEVVKLSGYIQPQFQFASKKGAKTYSGGDFPEHANNRFMLRRGRIRFDYIHQVNEKTVPAFQFALQLDGTERGVFIRDLWGKVFENKWQMFSLTTGMFARPFGYELNLASADRESPERGRMSQTLMKTERDLGVMASFHPESKDHPLYLLEIDAGFFNGQGLTAFQDFDSYKDFIARASLKPYKIAAVSLSGGLSYFNGGLLQNSRYINKVSKLNGSPIYMTDSSLSNVGGKAPRKYKGADVQVKWMHGKSISEFRAEYWFGKQTSVASKSESPDALPNEPYYLRSFDGAFFYLLHQFNPHHQVAVKFDWYDPNTAVETKAVTGRDGFGTADIRYNTIGFGYINYFNKNFKVVIWYDRVRNEKTSVANYTDDIADDIFTCRIQFRF